MKKCSWTILFTVALILLMGVSAQANELKLPSGLKTIEEEAFQGDTALDQVILPESLESIGDRAFAGSSVKSIQIPAGVSSIGAGAFDGCVGLTSVYFDGSQENWDSLSAGSGISELDHVTVYCLGGIDVVDSGTCGDSLTWTLDANGLLTISGTGPMTDYSYSNSSPWNETQISSVLIMPGVTSVGNNAFYNYSSNIRSVSIPDSVVSIGKWAFSGNSRLQEVLLPEGLQKICSYAFDYCSGLSAIHIPASITKIGSDAFDSCYSLNAFSVAEDNAYYSTVNGALFNKDRTELICLPASATGSYVVPDGVATIFHHVCGLTRSLTEIILPSTISDISSSAFNGCTGLQTITVSADNEFYRSIDGALYNASATVLLCCPEGKSGEYTVPEGVTRISSGGFNNSRLSKVTLPESLTEIDASAFSACNWLTSIVIPPQITRIREYAFFGCALNSVTIPASVTVIEENAFSYCHSLKNVYYLGTEEEWAAIDIQNGNDYLLSAPLHASDTINKCGSELTWVLSDDGVLTISGTGDMYNYAAANDLPWDYSLVKTLIIEEGVTSIGTNAFYYCSGLTSVTLPESLNSLGDKAFYNCRSLSEVQICASLTSIGNYTFYGCTALTSISLPQALKTIGNYAFYGCTNLNSISIPGQVGNIGSYAFYNCRTLSEVIIQSGVSSLGARAFSNCSSLSSISLPDSLQLISEYAFYGCTVLQEINLPNSLESIGNYAFANCKGLEEITIPAAVASIGSSAFLDCIALTSVIVDEGNTNYCCQNDCLIDSVNGILLMCPVDKTGECSIQEGIIAIENYAFKNCESITSFILPDSLRSIGTGAFYGCISLEDITIPEGTVTVGNYAAAYCSSLQEATIPGSVTSIGSSVFYSCTNLEKIYCMKDSYAYNYLKNYYSGLIVEYLGYEESNPADFVFESIDEATCKITGYNGTGGNVWIPSYSTDGLKVVAIGAEAFKNSASYKQITGIKIPEGVTEIGESAFANCTNVTEIVLPDTLVTICSSAFENCHNLERIELPSGITIINNRTFAYCFALTSVTFRGELTSVGERAFYRCDKMKALNLPQTVTNLGKWAFADNIRLESFAFPASLESISERALSGCRGLQQITIPEGVRHIEASAFSGCSGLETITLPSTLQSIAGDAFYECTGLTSIVIPSSVTEMGDDIFYGCTNLQSAVLPDAIKEIRGFDYCSSLTDLSFADDAILIDLYYCSALTELAIPETVTSLSLSYCSALTSVTIPGACTEIEEYAFVGCTSLQDIYIPASVTKINKGAFSSCESLEHIQLPGSITELGERAFSNSGLKSIVMPDSVTVIADSVFFDCTSLQSVTLPSSITEIPAYMFFRCESLADILIPNGVKIIYSNAFSYCTGLTSIVLPDTIIQIWIEAFRHCTSLQEVVFPDQSDKEPGHKLAYTIYNGAFCECTALKKINLTPECIEIHSEAFKNCTGLVSFSIQESSTHVWLNKVGDRAFENCVNLKYISFGGSSSYISSFPWNVLNNCNSLTKFELPGQYRVTSLDGKFSACENLNSVKIPSSITSISGGFFEDCPNLQWIYCEDESYVWNWALDNGYTPMNYEDWSNEDESGETIPDFEGGFSEEEITMRVGQYIQLLGEVTSSEANIGRVTVTIDGYHIEGDDNDRYATKEFAGVQSVSLADYEEFILDGTKAPLNVPGSYTVKLWAKASGNDGAAVQLNEMTVHVNSWTGYVQAPKVYTYADSVNSFANGYVDNVDPVTVIGCNHGRYEIEMVLTAGGTAIRWVDAKWIGLYEWGATKLDIPTITYPAADGDSIAYGNIEVTWEAVAGAEYYVVSLRELDTDRLLIFNSDTGEETSTVLQATYFSPAMSYRLAVGAVPPGYDTTSNLVGWCERVFIVPELEENAEAGFTGYIYELSTEEAVQAASLRLRKNRGDDLSDLSSEPLADCNVKVTDIDDGTVYNKVSDTNGQWTCPELVYGHFYKIEFSKNNKVFFISMFQYQAIGEMDQVASAFCYDESLAGIPAQLLRVDYDGTVSSLPHGLYAEYFAFESGSDRNKFLDDAEYKRAEGTVSNVDFSWVASRKTLTNYALNPVLGERSTSYNYLMPLSFAEKGNGTSETEIRYLSERFGVKMNGYLCVDLSLTGDDGISDTVLLRVRGDDGVKLKLERNSYDKQEAKDWTSGYEQISSPLLEAVVGTVYKLEIQHYSKGGDANLILEYNPYPKNHSNFKNGWKTVPSAWLYQGNRTVYISSATELQTIYAMRNDAVSETMNNYMHETWKELLSDLISDYVSDPLSTNIGTALNIGIDYHSSAGKIIKKKCVDHIKSKVTGKLSEYLCAVLTEILAGDLEETLNDKNVSEIVWEKIKEELEGIAELPSKISTYGDFFEQYLYICTVLDNQKELGHITQKLDKINGLLSFSDYDHRHDGYKLMPETTVETLLYTNEDTQEKIEDMKDVFDGNEDTKKLYKFVKDASNLLLDLEKDADRARATISLLYNEQGYSWFRNITELIGQYSSGDLTGASNLETMLGIQMTANNNADRLNLLLTNRLPYLTGKQCAQILAANQKVSLDHLLYRELFVLTLDAAKGAAKALFQ